MLIFPKKARKKLGIKPN